MKYSLLNLEAKGNKELYLVVKNCSLILKKKLMSMDIIKHRVR